MKHLILQVLGTSDIIYDGRKGFEKLLHSYSLEDIKQKAEYNEKDLIDQLDRVNFPLIQKLHHSRSSDTELLFCFILTDQVRWIQSRNVTEDWNSVATSDGIWWRNILSAWCKQQNLNHHLIILDIESEIPNGAADWEGMAAMIEPLLDDFFLFQNNSIYFQPKGLEKFQIDKIILQHSSGTPALSSALYLWGIEQKLSGSDIEFVYISEQDKDCPTHSGIHWQWRLKVPQIRELLEIQDFNGALMLLDQHHPKYTKVADSLSSLDRAVSLNLEGLNLDIRDSIIERISIAIWSEKAFRERSQWMQWYLRMAGALELALLLLVEKQGNGDYQWENHKLIDGRGQGEKVSSLSIAEIVSKLLTEGQLDRKGLTPHTFTLTPISGSDWREFKKFYVDWWQLEKRPTDRVGFITLRNNLYHSLMGDSIDRLLDLKTQELNNEVYHPEHPSQIAVEWLNYIIRLAGVSARVDKKSQEYRDRVSEVLQNL